MLQDTLRENVAHGRPDAGDETWRRVLEGGRIPEAGTREERPAPTRSCSTAADLRSGGPARRVVIRRAPCGEAIRDHPRLELQVIAAGSALLVRFGGAVHVLEEAGFRPDVKIRLIVEGQTPATMARVSARREETARSLVTATRGHRRHPPPGHRHPRARAGGGGSGGRLERAAVEAEGHHQGCAGHGVGDDAGVEAEHPSHQVLGHDLAGRALGHDAAAGYGHQVVGVAAGVVEAVEDEHHGAALGGVESGEQVEHLHLVGQIQERGGLVEQHDGCALGQGLAIHARWRWPPESSSTGRSASSVMTVATMAAATTASSSAYHCWNQRWWG